jgi:type I restriction-modification system DNA methylase subunit
MAAIIQNVSLPFSETLRDAGYIQIYESLSHLREMFHKSGRFDDSNAKLDEVVKLLSTYLAYRRGEIQNFPHSSKTATEELIPSLQSAFAAVSKLPCYLNQDGGSVFGQAPSLALKKGDETLAKDLLWLVQNAIDAAFINRDAGNPFDVLNEAFGHFVRDNFRGNIEDAQYMTPPEVVEFMVDLALADLAQVLRRKDVGETFVVADPSCGVGSFLAMFYHKLRHTGLAKDSKVALLGQDKVERMVRLAKVNLALFDVLQHSITFGNSLFQGSPLDQVNGQVDLILTNPPFGAKFNKSDVHSCGPQNLPFFNSIANGQRLDSELLFVDRNLALLKEGGLLLIVVPDSVISAKGMPSLLRQHLRSKTTIRAIVELPSVTFAQAGTRTKTAVLYLQKEGPTKSNPKRAFFAKVERIGFEVSSRKGVAIKVPQDLNELPKVLSAYAISKKPNPSQILSEEPSCVITDYQNIFVNAWTPSHYHPLRLKAFEQFSRIPSEYLQILELKDLAEFQSQARRTQKWRPGVLFISVLHVIGEGVLDVPGIRQYSPKTPGFPIEPGDVLISKINPRIPRVLVVPRWGEQLLCSTEFEVMRPRNGFDPYRLAFLLLSKIVQDQIKNLTSGTSASHSRIRSRELAEVKIPVPLSGSPTEHKLNSLVRKYRISMENMVNETVSLASVRASENCWLDVQDLDGLNSE